VPAAIEVHPEMWLETMLVKLREASIANLVVPSKSKKLVIEAMNPRLK
jgi:hypothetical protein